MRERTIEAGGASLFLREWGASDAPAVVYWHALGGHTGLEIAEAAALLVDEYHLRVIAVDAPGFGATPALGDPEEYLLTSLADLAARLIEMLGLDGAVWMGLSWGGHIGVHVGAGHPERISALVLLDAGYIDPQGYEGMSLEEVKAEVAAEPGFRFPSWQALLDEEKAYAHRRSPALEAELRSAYREDGDEVVSILDPATCATALWGARKTPSVQALPALGRSGLPVLLLAATEPPEREAERAHALERFVHLVPQVQVHRVEGAGHHLLRDAPEEVARLAGRWLRTLPSWQS